ncbi:MAG: Glu/Leu/Phe/Val dehydrogenase dimerization domain-containing protein [Planctomycetota bacterium]
MGIHILDALAREGFEEVVALHDRASRLRGFLGIHDSVHGPAFGGIRLWSYQDEDQALRDCLRLSRAMTHKCALAGLPAGGAKIVLLDRPELELRGAYAHLGDVLERLAGRVYAGPDVGTGSEQLEWVSERTRFVTRPEPHGPGSLADSTCAGVIAGMSAALRHLDGEEDWSRRTVVVQGLGEIGQRVARRLREKGARVLAAELDSERAARVARELDVELVDAACELDQPCDIFAPCALGGILHDLSITRLHCRIVAGAANNVLVRSVHADRLHALGILYVPDIALSAGALIRGALFHLEGRREPVEAIGARVGATVTALLEDAREKHAPPARVAVDSAEARIAAWRAGADARRVTSKPISSPAVSPPRP